ncbi:shikimate kinase 3, chloroplastic [Selaginella moellendorffii]|uniref:shikimate kinase 3, chloroplastic n=1 Tax=Selaginella moellendorffii TaxID=88036 RepID=UPI000D1C36DF|nr:shikimate kinase 3, chloroplastic [Selaginella moellendorffii]|eukprot:XP_024529110.1 shikimate kinase 3, chloroplastic [Selaginella moellendorffii]
MIALNRRRWADKSPTLAQEIVGIRSIVRHGLRLGAFGRDIVLEFRGAPRRRWIPEAGILSNPSQIHHRARRSVVLLCSQNANVAATESTSVDTALKSKGKELARDLKGTCLFLIGMMGSGKSTVGKHLSDALGYYFFDSDKLVEQAAGGASVAQIFKQSNEEGFRDAESEVLSQLSGMYRLVVATGGGAVVRPQNWGYMRHGITVYLDVPLDALAKRVVAAGTEKRPLLGEPQREFAHEQTLARLTKLYEERGMAYKNADVSVCLKMIANEMNAKDICELTPSIIALKIMERTQELIRSQKHYGSPRIGLF